MLMNQTIDQLRQLRMHGMAAKLEDMRTNTNLQSLSFEERLGLCVDAEIHDREDRRQVCFLKTAKLKVRACVEDIDFSVSRGLDRPQVTSLMTCDWIVNSLNTIITGPTGVGKTWLGCALGYQAIRKGYSVFYQRLSRLLEDLEIARGDGSLSKLRTKLAKFDLIIIDDWALAPMTEQGRQDLLELVDDRIDTGSILITSQLPVSEWHAWLDEPTVADAIMDRLVHRAHRIELRGESLRKQRSANREDTSCENS